jgi:DNA-binding beta-propeller fold protein YncE
MAGVTAVLIMLGTIGLSGVAEAVPGAVLWTKRYNGPANGYDAASKVAVSPDGTKVYVTGSSVASNGYSDYETIAYSASGALLWVRRYNGPVNGEDHATAISRSPDGTKVYVTGSSVGLIIGSDGVPDYATIAYNATTGALLWVRRYNGPGNSADAATAVAVTPDGTKVAVTGRSSGSDLRSDYATIVYNPNGAVVWTTRFGFANLHDFANAVAVSPDGTTVYVTGDSPGSTGASDVATVAYNATTGALLWAERYNGPGNGEDHATAVAVSPDGTKVFVAGPSLGPHSIGEDGNYDYATIAYNATTGAVLWVRRYNAAGNDADNARSVVVSPDGTKVYVTGTSVTGTGNCFCDDYATIAYNATTGAVVWIRRYNGPSNGGDAASAVAVSPNGTKVYVTGSSVGSTGTYNYATVAYDAATGAFGWAKRYDGPGTGDDWAYGVAVSPNSAKVYVTGESVGSTSNSDYATIAYSAT